MHCVCFGIACIFQKHGGSSPLCTHSPASWGLDGIMVAMPLPCATQGCSGSVCLRKLREIQGQLLRPRGRACEEDMQNLQVSAHIRQNFFSLHLLCPPTSCRPCGPVYIPVLLRSPLVGSVAVGVLPCGPHCCPPDDVQDLATQASPHRHAQIG